MRRLSNAPLRRGKAKPRAHRTVQKRVRLNRRRPDLLVKTSQQHAIERQKPRFKQTQNLEARMAALSGRRADPRERVVEQRRILVERAVESVVRGFPPRFHQLIQCVETVRRGTLPLGLRERGVERRAMGLKALAERRGCFHVPQRRQGGDQIAKETLRGGPLLRAEEANGRVRVPIFSRASRGGERFIQIVKRGQRRGAKDAEFESACRLLQGVARPAEPHRLMSEERLRWQRSE